MHISRTISDIRATVGAFRQAGESIGLVTTMGALHDGHLALISEARAAHERVIATIFVNPTQFGNASDLKNYPRTEASDIAKLEAAGTDAVFIPESREIYPDGDETFVETERLANMLHGLVRPGHFRGVATVVAKLFNIIQADAAYFGEKDYQQLQVIRRMVRDLHIPISVRGVTTVRESDGLAMSSRNVRLAPEDRIAARVLNKALENAEAIVKNRPDVATLTNEISAMISAEPRARLVGIDITEATTLAPLAGPINQRVAIMISVAFGEGDNEVLLIDQREIEP
ncbi:pantoate--beta-alanine ligase [Pelagovum sp. HNIBRBA483]|uniref:pantoate--beta-alanine ligase n=1 Tax=Pelagovum sp. HNIBRBA483 TaxID=3233341 RepID=UPI0034A2BD39